MEEADVSFTEENLTQDLDLGTRTCPRCFQITCLYCDLLLRDFSRFHK